MRAFLLGSARYATAIGPENVTPHHEYRIIPAARRMVRRGKEDRVLVFRVYFCGILRDYSCLCVCAALGVPGAVVLMSRTVRCGNITEW